MNAVNLQASVNNVTQMDRFANDASRTPLVHQDKTELIAQKNAEHRIRMPVEAEQAEHKKVDSKYKEQNQKKQKQRQQQKSGPARLKNRNNGLIVDIEA